MNIALCDSLSQIKQLSFNGTLIEVHEGSGTLDKCRFLIPSCRFKARSHRAAAAGSAVASATGSIRL